jgi:hypothetical protein
MQSGFDAVQAATQFFLQPADLPQFVENAGVIGLGFLVAPLCRIATGGPADGQSHVTGQ